MAESNLSRDIFAKLSDRILHWEYAPGQRLTEELLCDEFNVSRSPIREALQKLADKNLIDRKDRQGYRVKQLNLTEIHELYDVRNALETYVMERVCRDGMEESTILELEEHWNHLLRDLPNMGDCHVGDDEAFHRAFAIAAKNRMLQRMLNDIDDRIRFVRTNDITSHTRMRETCLEHLGILDAVRNHDAVKAITLLRQNIEAGRTSVEKVLKDVLARAHEHYE